MLCFMLNNTKEGRKGWTVWYSFYLPFSPNKIYMILDNVYLKLKITATKFQKLKHNIVNLYSSTTSVKITAHFNYAHTIWTKLQLLLFMYQNLLGK